MPLELVDLRERLVGHRFPDGGGTVQPCEAWRESGPRGSLIKGRMSLNKINGRRFALDQRATARRHTMSADAEKEPRAFPERREPACEGR